MPKKGFRASYVQKKCATTRPHAENDLEQQNKMGRVLSYQVQNLWCGKVFRAKTAAGAHESYRSSGVQDATGKHHATSCTALR